MDDLEISSNESENVAVAQPDDSQPETVQEHITQAQDAKSNSAFKEMRLARQRAERDKQDADNRIRMQEELIARLLQNQNNTPKVPEIDPLEELRKYGDTDYIPAGLVKQSMAAIEQRSEKRTLEAIDRKFIEKEKSDPFGKLRNKFSDFDDVVNPETLGLLEETDPDLAKEIAETKDPYKIGLLSYKNIKMMGLIEKAPVERRVKEVERKIEENKKTIQTPQVYDKRPMAQAFKMTDSEKKALYREMMDCASLSGGGY